MNNITVSEIKDINSALSKSNCFSLLLLIEGEIQASVGGESYDLFCGNCILILPNESFSFMTYSHSRCIFAEFDVEQVRELSLKTANKQAVIPIFNLSDEKITALLLSDDDLLIKSALYFIAHKFLTACPLTQRNNKAQDFMQQVIAYIEKNYDKDISLDTLAKFCGYNYHYMSSMFSTTFKTSFSQVVNNWRLKKAEELIKQDKLTMIEIAYRCGFKSLRSFNRNFLDYFGMSPTAYARKG